MSHWCVQAVHLLPTQRTSFLGSEGEQAGDLSTGSTPTGNVDGSFAFIVSCDEGLYIQPNRLHAHIGKSMCVCLSFRCHPMMWQSSMLISLLVLSHEQIIVRWVKHDILYRWPITLLEPLVVFIGCHIGFDGWSKVAIRVIWRYFFTPQTVSNYNFCPVPGSWMHRFSSSMPSCKTRAILPH